MSRIAFYTFGILNKKEGHPLVRGFFDKIELVFEQAKSSEGFIALSDVSWGTYVSPVFFAPKIHAEAPATLSLWSDIESVCAFAYRNGHSEALKQRNEFFIKPKQPTYAAWWVDDDQIPDRAEACKRLEHLHDHGPGPFAFNFKIPFDNKGNPVELNKELLGLRIKANEKLKVKS